MNTTIEKPNIGIHLDVPAEEYHARKAISASFLKQMAISPAHGKHYLDYGVKETPSLALGRAIHTAVLESEKFPLLYTVAPDVDGRTKEGKAARAAHAAENAGKQIISADDWRTCIQMIAAVSSHRTARKYLMDGEGIVEGSHFWQLGDGREAKVRIDRETPNVIADLKSVEDASPSGFLRAVANYRWDIQDAWYLRTNPDKPFVFVAVEKKEPYAIGVYELDLLWVDLADKEINDLLEIDWRCREAGVYPSYGDFVQTLTRPRWMNGE